VERGRPSFNDRERCLLESLAPHLLAARGNAIRFSHALSRAARSCDDTDTSRLERLTERQRAILAQLATGQTNAQISLALGISTGTARKHVEHILRRLELPTRTAAAVMYLKASTPRTHPPWTASIPSMLPSGDEPDTFA
jgi:DNA-binding NarL/FixJ family response regulator